MNFLEKLDFLMDRYTLNKRTLSQKSKIPYTTIDNWYKRGYEGLKIPTLCKLSDFFNTTLDYWVVGEITDPNYGKSSGFKVEYDEMEHIKKYRSLDNFGKTHIDYELERESTRIAELKQKNDRIKELEVSTSQNGMHNETIRLINYYYRLAFAGTGQIVFDMPPTKKIEIPDIPEYKKVDYAIGVNGNSMEPEYKDGDILLIEMTEKIAVGEIGIFIVDGESYVKKMGNMELISLNPKYDNIPLTEDSKCMGKVVDKYRGYENNDKKYEMSKEK